MKRCKGNISYLHPGEKDSYKLERCKLDLHYPTDKKGFATLIWFHGGGLEAGEKHFFYSLIDYSTAVLNAFCFVVQENTSIFAPDLQ